MTGVAGGAFLPSDAQPIRKNGNSGATVVALGAFANTDRCNLLHEPDAPGPVQIEETQIAADYTVAQDTTVPIRMLDDLALSEKNGWLTTLSVDAQDGVWMMVGYRVEGSLVNPQIAMLVDDTEVPLRVAGGSQHGNAYLYGGLSARQYGIRLFATPPGQPPSFPFGSTVRWLAGGPDPGDPFGTLPIDPNATITLRAFATGGTGRIILDCLYIFPRYHLFFAADSSFAFYDSPWVSRGNFLFDVVDAPGQNGATVENGPGAGVNNGGYVIEERQTAPAQPTIANAGIIVSGAGRWFRLLILARTTADDGLAYAKSTVNGVDSEPITISGSSYRWYDLGPARFQNEPSPGETTDVDDVRVTAWNARAGQGVRIESVSFGVTGKDLIDPGTTLGGPATLFQSKAAELVLWAPKSGIGLKDGGGNLAPVQAWDGVHEWVSLSGRVRGITVDRGRQLEFDKIEPGTATIRLSNRDGALYPGNPGSPYAGFLGPGRIVRIQSDFAGSCVDGSDRVFTGIIERWRYPRKGRRDAEAVIELVELSAALAAGGVPLAKDVSAGYVTAERWYAPQHVDDRIRAAAADAGWPAALTLIDTGNVICQGARYPASSSYLEVIYDAVDAEFPGVAVFFCDGGGRLVFLGRRARIDATVKWTVGDQAYLLTHPAAVPIADEDPDLVDGDDHVINIGEYAPTGVQLANVPGLRVVDNASVRRYGPRSIGGELLLERADNGNTGTVEARRYNRFWVQNYAQAHRRFGQLTFKAQMSAAAAAFVRKVEIGDLLSVNVANPGGGNPSGQYFVEGLHHVIDPTVYPAAWTLRLDVSPRALWTDLAGDPL